MCELEFDREGFREVFPGVEFLENGINAEDFPSRNIAGSHYFSWAPNVTTLVLTPHLIQLIPEEYSELSVVFPRLRKLRLVRNTFQDYKRFDDGLDEILSASFRGIAGRSLPLEELSLDLSTFRSVSLVAGGERIRNVRHVLLNVLTPSTDIAFVNLHRIIGEKVESVSYLGTTGIVTRDVESYLHWLEVPANVTMARNGFRTDFNSIAEIVKIASTTALLFSSSDFRKAVTFDDQKAFGGSFVPRFSPTLQHGIHGANSHSHGISFDPCTGRCVCSLGIHTGFGLQKDSTTLFRVPMGLSAVQGNHTAASLLHDPWFNLSLLILVHLLSCEKVFEVVLVREAQRIPEIVEDGLPFYLPKVPLVDAWKTPVFLALAETMEMVGFVEESGAESRFNNKDAVFFDQHRRRIAFEQLVTVLREPKQIVFSVFRRTSVTRCAEDRLSDFLFRVLNQCKQLGTRYLLSGKFEEAKSELVQAVICFRSHLSSLTEPPRSAYVCQNCTVMNLLLCLIKCREWEACLRIGATVDSEYLTRSQVAKYHYRMGWANENCQRFIEARREYEVALQTDPNHQGARLRLRKLLV